MISTSWSRVVFLLLICFANLSTGQEERKDLGSPKFTLKDVECVYVDNVDSERSWRKKLYEAELSINNGLLFMRSGEGARMGNYDKLHYLRPSDLTPISLEHLPVNAFRVNWQRPPLKGLPRAVEIGKLALGNPVIDSNGATIIQLARWTTTLTHYRKLIKEPAKKIGFNGFYIIQPNDKDPKVKQIINLEELGDERLEKHFYGANPAEVTAKRNVPNPPVDKKSLPYYQSRYTTLSPGPVRWLNEEWALNSPQMPIYCNTQGWHASNEGRVQHFQYKYYHQEGTKFTHHFSTLELDMPSGKVHKVKSFDASVPYRMLSILAVDGDHFIFACREKPRSDSVQVVAWNRKTQENKLLFELPARNSMGLDSDIEKRIKKVYGVGYFRMPRTHVNFNKGLLYVYLPPEVGELMEKPKGMTEKLVGKLSIIDVKTNNLVGTIKLPELLPRVDRFVINESGNIYMSLLRPERESEPFQRKTIGFARVQKGAFQSELLIVLRNNDLSRALTLFQSQIASDDKHLYFGAQLPSAQELRGYHSKGALYRIPVE